jgi:Sugar phosphate isomerases/epimerases
MDHVLSTHLFVNSRLTIALLDRIWDQGIPAVEIFCARQHLDYRDRAQIRELGHWFRDSPLKLHSIHSPMFSDDVWGRSGPQAVLNITELSRPKRIAVTDEIKRALEIAETIPFRYLIQHVGVPGEEYDERRVDAAMTSLEEIKLFASQRGVEVLLENIPNQLSSAERLVQFLDRTRLGLGICFDVGHAHINEGVETAFHLLKDRIRSTHIHDNDGMTDQHLFPFAKGGTINWKRTMELFCSCPGQFPLLLELQEVPDLGQPLAAAQNVFERLEAL